MEGGTSSWMAERFRGGISGSGYSSSAGLRGPRGRFWSVFAASERRWIAWITRWRRGRIRPRIGRRNCMNASGICGSRSTSRSLSSTPTTRLNSVFSARWSISGPGAELAEAEPLPCGRGSLSIAGFGFSIAGFGFSIAGFGSFRLTDSVYRAAGFTRRPASV